MRVRIKICGITSVSDAEDAVAAGADALGFVFYAGSPRHMKLEQAAAICRALPPLVVRVGVFVNAAEAQVRAAITACGLEALQFHGDESPAFCRQFAPLKVIKALRLRDAASLAALDQYDTDAWLLDSYVPGRAGGTGTIFNWDLALQAKQSGRTIMLAGGLTPSNVGDAIERVQPFAVDVSSGVESAPGQKDRQQMGAFVRAVQAAGQRLG
jgi:phosphoribosylanthranilate isomerase